MRSALEIHGCCLHLSRCLGIIAGSQGAKNFPSLATFFLTSASAGSPIRDDKIVCAWNCDEWLCLQMLRVPSVTTIPVIHSMTRGGSDRHQTRAGVKENTLCWSPKEQKCRAKYFSCCKCRINWVGKGVLGSSGSTMKCM